MLLGSGAALNEHLQIQFLRRKSFQGVLANRAETILAYIAKQPIFQIGLAQVARIIVAQDTFHLRRRKDFADYVENGIVLERVPNLIELFQQPIEDVALHGIRRDEIEDEAIAGLTITMDAAHPLFEPIGVPWNVVVEHDVAALKIDALAGGLRCDQHLDCALTKLLFRVEPAPLHITRTDLHPPVY